MEVRTKPRILRLIFCWELPDEAVMEQEPTSGDQSPMGNGSVLSTVAGRE